MPDINSRALLPKGEANGFVTIVKELLDDPLRYRAALVIFNAKRGTVDYDHPEGTLLTIRVLRAARVLPQDLEAVEAMLRRSVEFDAGQPVLPLDLEDEIREAFKAMQDPDSPVDPANPDDPGNAPGQAEGGEAP